MSPLTCALSRLTVHIFSPMSNGGWRTTEERWRGMGCGAGHERRHGAVRVQLRAAHDHQFHRACCHRVPRPPRAPAIVNCEAQTTTCREARESCVRVSTALAARFGVARVMWGLICSEDKRTS